MLLIFDVMENCLTLQVYSYLRLSSFISSAVLIPRYISLTYAIDNGFKLLLARVSFMTVLNHSLYKWLQRDSNHSHFGQLG